MTRTQPRLCIVAPWIYPLFTPHNQGHFGGWEVRMALIARELTRRGTFKVSVLTGDYGQPHIEKIENIEFYSWRGREIWGITPQPVVNNHLEDFWRHVRFPFRPKLQAGRVAEYQISPEMIAVYDEIDADIYTVPGNSQYSGELAFYCNQRNKMYFYLAGSDFDLYPEYKTEPDKVDMYGVPYALKTYALENAKAHFLQNEKQAKMLEDGFGINGIIIRNPIDITPIFPRPMKPETILWVGKSDERIKRPSLVFELARHLPQFSFVVIMNEGVPETHTNALLEAKALPNITLIERVSFDEIERYYAAARLFVNTSVFEGFPNTFLQAAKYGVPIITSEVDPGGMLSLNGCGICCAGDFEYFVESVQQVMTDDALYAKLSAVVLQYVHTYHDKDIVISQYENAFREVLIR